MCLVWNDSGSQFIDIWKNPWQWTQLVQSKSCKTEAKLKEAKQVKNPFLYSARNVGVPYVRRAARIQFMTGPPPPHCHGFALSQSSRIQLFRWSSTPAMRIFIISANSFHISHPPGQSPDQSCDDCSPVEEKWEKPESHQAVFFYTRNFLVYYYYCLWRLIFYHYAHSLRDAACIHDCTLSGQNSQLSYNMSFAQLYKSNVHSLWSFDTKTLLALKFQVY